MNSPADIDHDEAEILREVRNDEYVFRLVVRPLDAFARERGGDDLHWMRQNFERLENAAKPILDFPAFFGGVEAIWPPSKANLPQWRQRLLTHIVFLWAALDSLASLYGPLAEGARDLRQCGPDNPQPAASGAGQDGEWDEDGPVHIHRDVEQWSRELLLQINVLKWAARDLDKALEYVHELLTDVDFEGLPPVREAA